MKTIISILTLITFTIILGCGQTANQDKQVIIKNEPVNKKSTSDDLAKIERQKQIRTDSFRLDSAIKDAFRIAQVKFKSDNFTKRYDLIPDDSSYVINIDIVVGRLFKDKQRYFLLRRFVPGITYLDLYKINDGKAERLIEREENGYIRDTIFDVNGDGCKDFLVHWQPLAGSFERNVYDVYLNLPDKGILTTEYGFINPTFSAKEKVIRGVEYGAPGEIGLYKCKWNGLKVDTIEFIYPDVNHKGQFIKTKRSVPKPTEEEGIVLKAVPKEYLKIESYEWFMEFQTMDDKKG